ncbi:MAG TPA: hypothetical protein VF241_10855, partial [Propionibacteriaceae bacterium]
MPTRTSTDPTTEARSDDLPPALAAMWRLCRLGYTHEPRLVVFAVILTLCQAIPDALFALWLKVLADAVVAANTRLVFAMVAAMAVSVTLTWL